MGKLLANRPLVSAGLFAAGLWCLLAIQVANQPLLESSLALGAWFIGGAFIGAALFNPFKVAWLGAWMGVLAQLTLLMILIFMTPI
jgi:hypothetical protein